METKQEFLDGKIAIEIHNEKDCQELLDFLGELGVNIVEIDEGTCIKYPYFFLETDTYLQATKSEWTCRELKLRIVPFNKVFTED